MGEEQEVAAITARLEQAERTLREALSLIHELANRLDKLEHALGLLICGQALDAESKQAIGAESKQVQAITEQLSSVSFRRRRVGDK